MALKPFDCNIAFSEYGVVLAELTASGDVGVAYRQLASVLLRQYLDCHWSSLAENFAEPVPTDLVREKEKESNDD